MSRIIKVLSIAAILLSLTAGTVSASEESEPIPWLWNWKEQFENLQLGMQACTLAQNRLGALEDIDPDPKGPDEKPEAPARNGHAFDGDFEPTGPMGPIPEAPVGPIGPVGPGEPQGGVQEQDGVNNQGPVDNGSPNTNSGGH